MDLLLQWHVEPLGTLAHSWNLKYPGRLRIHHESQVSAWHTDSDGSASNV